MHKLAFPLVGTGHETIPYQIRKTWNRSHLLPVTGGLVGGREVGKYRPVARHPVERTMEGSARRDVSILVEAATGAQATTSGDPFAVVPAAGPMVHSKEDNRKSKPTAMINPCFTYLCVKTTGRCKRLFSKETILSSKPTKKVRRLDSTFPFRLRVGRITRRTTCQVKIKMSVRKSRAFCTIF